MVWKIPFIAENNIEFRIVVIIVIDDDSNIESSCMHNERQGSLTEEQSRYCSLNRKTCQDNYKLVIELLNSYKYQCNV